jgi:hypothetical protein
LAEFKGSTTLLRLAAELEEKKKEAGRGDPDLTWMDTSDASKGFRQSTANPSVYFAVSKQTKWDRTRAYDAPAGFRWATTQEGAALFSSKGDPFNDGEPTYFEQAGWDGYEWGGATRVHFRFADSRYSFAYKDAMSTEEAPMGADDMEDDFAGIVCIKNETH